MLPGIAAEAAEVSVAAGAVGTLWVPPVSLGCAVLAVMVGVVLMDAHEFINRRARRH